MQRLALLVALLLALSACGGASRDVEQTPTSAPAATATGNSPSASPESQGSDEPAIDFALLLADGTTFTLSDEQKPVYLVFWAEW
jgi:hypothetical protein